jgi:hypothetical protein
VLGELRFLMTPAQHLDSWRATTMLYASNGHIKRLLSLELCSPDCAMPLAIKRSLGDVIAQHLIAWHRLDSR